MRCRQRTFGWFAVECAGCKIVGSINKVTAEANKAKRESSPRQAEVAARIRALSKSLTSYGAFADVGGVDGLCHISELSWNNIKHPSEVVKVGDEIEVYVKSYDPENQKVSWAKGKVKRTTPGVKLENEVPCRYRVHRSRCLHHQVRRFRPHHAGH